eukprot:SAG31_NODE_4194_length_3486_cov_1.765870_5_plen_151_part_00
MQRCDPLAESCCEDRDGPRPPCSFDSLQNALFDRSTAESDRSTAEKVGWIAKHGANNDVVVPSAEPLLVGWIAKHGANSDVVVPSERKHGAPENLGSALLVAVELGAEAAAVSTLLNGGADPNYRYQYLEISRNISKYLKISQNIYVDCL